MLSLLKAPPKVKYTIFYITETGTREMSSEHPIGADNAIRTATEGLQERNLGKAEICFYDPDEEYDDNTDVVFTVVFEEAFKGVL
jgi:hypothetical protein